MSKKHNNTEEPADNEDLIVIVADEVNDPGKFDKNRSKKNPPARTFGIGVSIVRDLNGFADITRSFKIKKGIRGEFKARKRTTFEKIILGWKVRRNGAKMYGFYVDKARDVPEGWNEQKGTDIQIGMLQEILDRMIPKTRSGNVRVVVDDQEIFTDKKTGRNIVEDMSASLSDKHNRKIRCTTAGKESDEFFGLVETNDLVTNAINDRMELGKPWASFVMGQKIIRLGNKDSIRRR